MGIEILFRNEILKLSEAIGVKLIYASNVGQNGIVGIHLLNPSLDEVHDALERCERDGFSRIIIHSIMTWPGSQKRVAV